MPAITGDCHNYVTRWYYDLKGKRCNQFYYGGCGGNGNNFQSEEECMQRCERKQEQPPPEEFKPGIYPPGFTKTYLIVSIFQKVASCQVSKAGVVDHTPNGSTTAEMGSASSSSTVVATVMATTSIPGRSANSTAAMSKVLPNHPLASFLLNSSIFCLSDLCQLPRVVGPCNSDYPQWYYNKDTDQCEEFNYGGCHGNENRFSDRESCERRCKQHFEPALTTRAPGEFRKKCRLDTNLEIQTSNFAQ